MKIKTTMNLLKQIFSAALLTGFAANASAATYSSSIVRNIDAGTVTVTNPNQQTLKYSYDDVDNLTGISIGAEASPSYSYQYDATDQLTKIIYPGGEQTYTIDPYFDRVTEVYDFGQTNPMLLFEYDHKHRITWITYPGDNAANATQVCYEYDADGRLTRVGRSYTTNAGICNNAEEKTDYSYDALGRLETITYPKYIVGFRSYHPDTGLLKSAGYKRTNGTLLYSDVFEYVHGSALYKTVTRHTSTDKKTTHYQYDDYQRLTQVIDASGRKVDYEYDDFGNRTKETISNIKDPNAPVAIEQKPYGVYEFIYTNKSNRLERVNYNGVLIEDYSYDNAGQMNIRTRYDASGNQVTDYDFNALGKLVKVTLPDTTIIEYNYDGLGVRKSKSINGALDTQYLSANIFGLPYVLMELDAGLGIKASYVYASGQQLKEEPNAEVRTEDLYKLHNGMVGSITHEINSSGIVKNEYDYDAFGARTKLNVTSGKQHYGYTGEEFDTETGLLYLRARYYDPLLGRFISADPYLGRVAEPITQNRYIYVHNNPLGLVDPSGLASAGELCLSVSSPFYSDLSCLGVYSDNHGNAIMGTVDGKGKSSDWGFGLQFQQSQTINENADVFTYEGAGGEYSVNSGVGKVAEFSGGLSFASGEVSTTWSYGMGMSSAKNVSSDFFITETDFIDSTYKGGGKSTPLFYDDNQLVSMNPISMNIVSNYEQSNNVCIQGQ